MASPVVLFGATGYTGRLIAEKLIRSRVPFTAVGRDPDKLEQMVSAYKTRVPFKVAYADDIESVRKVLVRGTKVLVNCVGPFIDLGENIVKAAIEKKVNYLDTTGELFFIREMHWRYHALAEKAGRLVVNSMAFEYALGDFGADMMEAHFKTPLDILEIYYYIPNLLPSQGSKRSMLSAMSKPVYGFEGSRLVQIKAGTFRRNLHFKGQKKPLSALSFPGGEIFTVPQHVTLKTLREYMVMSVSAARLLYGSSPSVIRASSKARSAEEAGHLAGPTRAQRSENQFNVILEGTSGNATKALYITGKDVYGLTATMIAFGVRQILEKKQLGKGVLSPAQAFDAKAFWAQMKQSKVACKFSKQLVSG